MKRKKIALLVGVSASVLLVSSLLVACVAEDATGPGQSETASSLSQAENASVSTSVSGASSTAASSSRNTSQSQSTTGRDSSSSDTMTESSRSQPPVSSSRPASSDTMQNPEPPAPAPSQQEPAAPPPAPPAPTPEPPPPTPSVNVQSCLEAAAAWAGQRNMTVNGNLYIGGAGHENPIDTTGKTDADVIAHLEHQLGLIYGQLTAMPEYDPETKYPCYKFVVDGSLIYVLYG